MAKKKEVRYVLTKETLERWKFSHREVGTTRTTLCGLTRGPFAWPDKMPTCAVCRRAIKAQAAAAGK